jgi:hypothetical protein
LVKAQTPDEVERAKRRLRLEGDGLQAELELAWLPVERGARLHPWRTLALAATGGALTGRIDDATDGRLHRLALMALRPFLRTLIARSGLKRS